MQQVSPLDVTISVLYRDLATIDERDQRGPKTKGEAASRSLYLDPMVS
jgi:hypothetical protein